MRKDCKNLLVGSDVPLAASCSQFDPVADDLSAAVVGCTAPGQHRAAGAGHSHRRTATWRVRSTCFAPKHY